MTPGTRRLGHGTRTLGHGVGTLGHGVGTLRHGVGTLRHGVGTLRHGVGTRTLRHGVGTRTLRLPEPVPWKPWVIRFSSRRREHYYNRHDHYKNKHAVTRILFHLVFTVKLIYRGHQSFGECFETC